LEVGRNRRGEGDPPLVLNMTFEKEEERRDQLRRERRREKEGRCELTSMSSFSMSPMDSRPLTRPALLTRL